LKQQEKQQQPQLQQQQQEKTKKAEEIHALPGEMGNPNLMQLEKRVKQPISRLHWQHM
jgi:hypothetical protein